MMKDFDVYELKTAEEIDAAFAKTFGLESCGWAAGYDQDAVTDFLEGMRGKHYVYSWSVECRNWVEEGSRFKCIVSNQRSRGGVRLGHVGWGHSEYACHALMKAAIHWDQRRRDVLRLKAAKKREDARVHS